MLETFQALFKLRNFRFKAVVSLLRYGYELYPLPHEALPMRPSRNSKHWSVSQKH